MRNLFFLLVITLPSFISSCTEKLDIAFPDNNPKLVVECELLSTDTEHYMKLSLSKASFPIYEPIYGVENFIPVTGAQINVSDNAGNIFNFNDEPIPKYYYFYSEDSTVQDSGLIINERTLSRGYYHSNNLIIEAGRTYYLNIQWNGQKYTSSCYVPFAPQIDSVTIAFNQGAIGKSDYYIPYIWFTDNPNTVDYYLFVTQGGGGIEVWTRAILSDEFIKAGTNGYDVFKGESVDYWRNAYPIEDGPDYRIEMRAITKEIYEYNKVLITQFRNDGGVYTPSPISPPTNISNGALGYFCVSDVRALTIVMP